MSAIRLARGYTRKPNNQIFWNYHGHFDGF